MSSQGLQDDNVPIPQYATSRLGKSSRAVVFVAVLIGVVLALVTQLAKDRRAPAPPAANIGQTDGKPSALSGADAAVDSESTFVDSVVPPTVLPEDVSPPKGDPRSGDAEARDRAPGTLAKEDPTIPQLASARRSAAAAQQRAGEAGSATKGVASSKQVMGAGPSPELVVSQTAATLAKQRRSLDPVEDGWNSEALSSATSQQLTALSDWMKGSLAGESGRLDEILADGFNCGRLRPPQLDEVFDDGRLSVRRALTTEPELASAPTVGLAGGRAAIRDLLAPLAGATDVHIKFKQYQIDLRATTDVSELTTTAYFHASGKQPRGRFEQNATWTFRWRLPAADRPPQLTQIRMRDYEEAETDSGASELFADCTEAVLGDSPAYQQQLRFGIPYWRQRLESNLNVQYHGQAGLAVADVNGDGLDDLYLCQPGGLPNTLFIQQDNGTVRDFAHEAGVDILNYTRSALFVDLDNDGDQDLAVTTDRLLAIFANDGAGHFVERARWTEIAGAYSLSAVDYDSDADLDLYVCRYLRADTKEGGFPTPYPYHDANNGGRNVLLRNEGSWQFQDVTDEVGLDVENRRFSFAASWEDYDNDGDQDLYVANDFGRNCLYRNEGGRFLSAAAQAGLEDTAFGMSVSWGDYNLDGQMDLYVGNMFSAAGNRITFQPEFKEGASAKARASIQRTARGNSLYENTGQGQFRDVSSEAAVTMGRWSWGSLFADINNDGQEDLLVTNGNITGEQTDDL